MMKRIDREKVKELVLKGLKDREIANILGCSIYTISTIRTTELGILKNPKRGEKTKKILSLWEKGYRNRSLIAKLVGCHPYYVCSVLLRYGLREPARKIRLNHVKFFETLLNGPKTSDELKSLGFNLDQQRLFYKELRIKNYPIYFIKVGEKRVYFCGNQIEEAKIMASKIANNSMSVSDIFRKKVDKV